MPTTWTYSVAPEQPIRAFNLTQLRQAIDQNRSAAGLYAFRWTDSVAAGTPAKAVHVIELRYALQELWVKKRLG